MNKHPYTILAREMQWWLITVATTYFQFLYISAYLLLLFYLLPSIFHVNTWDYLVYLTLKSTFPILSNFKELLLHVLKEKSWLFLPLQSKHQYLETGLKLPSRCVCLSVNFYCTQCKMKYLTLCLIDIFSL